MGPSAAPILLVGMMGAGKTTVGRRLAAALDRPFVDNDVAFERRTGVTPAEHARRHGDDAMHRTERDALVELLASPEPAVIAAPGSVIDMEGLELTDVTVVWLRATARTLAGRVDVGDHRPLLGTEPGAVLERLADGRAPRYEALADLVVDVDDRTPEQVVARILAMAPFASSRTDGHG